jgi:hypothetical protein
MKSVDLSKEQIQKLLSIAKVLFPEYDFTFRHGVEPNQAIGFNVKGDASTFDEIHWFEFCTIYVLRALLREGGGREFIEYLENCYEYESGNWDFFADSRHPIDYLHEIFLKLQ